MKKWFVRSAVLLGLSLAMLLNGARVDASPPARDCGNSPVSISDPQPGSTVSGDFSIAGTATLPAGEFQYYQVDYSYAGQNTWGVILAGVRTPVVNGILATVNGNMLAPGDYTLRVRVVDRTANYCDAFVSPVHVNLTAPDTATPEASPTPDQTPTPNATSTGQPTAPTQNLAGSSIQAASRTPTLSIQIPTSQPQTDALLSQDKPGSALSALPLDQISSWGTAAGDWMSSLGQAFIFGIQLTAGLFFMLGVIAFLRRNL